MYPVLWTAKNAHGLIVAYKDYSLEKLKESTSIETVN